MKKKPCPQRSSTRPQLGAADVEANAGTYLGTWGSYGSGEGEFISPTQLEVDGFGDILVEVYGYARSRRVIWLGFASNAVAALRPAANRHDAEPSHHSKNRRSACSKPTA